MIPLKAQEIIDRLESLGFVCYMVGGAVRDYLLGLPIKEIDLVTSATPEELARIFSDSKVELVGKRFSVTFIDGIEVATFRGEIYKKPGKPEVFTLNNFEADAGRRDFTINAMAMDSKGQIFDYYNGQKDLKAKILKTVGRAQLRFEEDPIRILRGLTFACRLSLSIEENTKQAMKEGASALAAVPKERIGKEAKKAYQDKTLRCWLQKMEELNLLNPAIPQLAHLPGKEQNPHYHHLDVWQHTLAALAYIENLPKVKEELIWAALFHDIAKGLPEIRTYSSDSPYPRDHGHELLGPEIADMLMESWGMGKTLRKKTCLLILHHMWLPEDLKGATVIDYLNPMARHFKFIDDFKEFLDSLFLLKQADIEAKNPANRQKDEAYLKLTFQEIFRLLEIVPFFRNQTDIDPKSYQETGPALDKRLQKELIKRQKEALAEHKNL